MSWQALANAVKLITEPQDEPARWYYTDEYGMRLCFDPQRVWRAAYRLARMGHTVLIQSRENGHFVNVAQLHGGDRIDLFAQHIVSNVFVYIYGAK